MDVQPVMKPGKDEDTQLLCCGGCDNLLATLHDVGRQRFLGLAEKRGLFIILDRDGVYRWGKRLRNLYYKRSNRRHQTIAVVKRDNGAKAKAQLPASLKVSRDPTTPSWSLEVWPYEWEPPEEQYPTLKVECIYCKRITSIVSRHYVAWT